METLLLIALITWGLARYAGTELIATARGTEPPRLRDRQRRAERAHERRMARENRRTGPTVGDALAQRIADRIAHPRGARTPGPARAAMGEWWSDAWGYATERRRERHQRHANGELLRQRVARNLRERFGGNTDPHRPRPTASQWPPRRPDHPEPVVIDADPAPDQPTGQTEPTTADDDNPTTADPDRDEEPGQPVPDDQPTPEPTAPEPEPEPRPAAEHQPTATIHPIREDIPMTGANPTLTSGETLDPGSANHFCEQMQNVGQRLLTELDQSIASLSQAGVSGEPIRLLEQMRENAQLFADSAGEAGAHFARHLNTQDQVLSDDTLAGTVNGTYIGTRS